jgi:hypothetical protein
LEIVFHEAAYGMMGKVMDSIVATEESAGARSEGGLKHFRRDLWHEVLFYTSVRGTASVTKPEKDEWRAAG